MAQHYVDKMDKVISGPAPDDPPSADPMDASIVTRFVKEFELQEEALALQLQVSKKNMERAYMQTASLGQQLNCYTWTRR